MKNIQIKLKKDGLCASLKHGWHYMVHSIHSHIFSLWYSKNIHTFYPTEKKLDKQRQAEKSFDFHPLISVIMPVKDPRPEYLKDAINSVIEQTYGNWELVLIDDASVNPKIIKMLKQVGENRKIRIIKLKKSRNIVGATNKGISISQGKYIGFLDHDDILWPNALYEIVHFLNKEVKKEIVLYSDEDKLDLKGKHSDPFFKPDFSPDLLQAVNYITHFTLYPRSILEKMDFLREGTDGAQDWDLVLRSSQITSVKHVPKILYSWRKSMTSSASKRGVGTAKQFAYRSQKEVIENHLGKPVEPTRYQGIWKHPTNKDLLLHFPKWNKELVKKSLFSRCHLKVSGKRAKIILPN